VHSGEFGLPLEVPDEVLALEPVQGNDGAATLRILGADVGALCCHHTVHAWQHSSVFAAWHLNAIAAQAQQADASTEFPPVTRHHILHHASLRVARTGAANRELKAPRQQERVQRSSSNGMRPAAGAS
jgi:hypothetical protein